jgi:Protein of unknown function (DUF2001).
MEYANAISANEGKIFMTIAGKTRQIGELIKLEASIEINTIDVRVAGKRFTGKKAGTVTGSGSVKFHFIQNALRDVTAEYIKTGVYPLIDVQAINDDPAVSGSRIVHNLRGCIFTKTLLNLVDGESDDIVTEESDFTFNDYKKV